MKYLILKSKVLYCFVCTFYSIQRSSPVDVAQYYINAKTDPSYIKKRFINDAKGNIVAILFYFLFLLFLLLLYNMVSHCVITNS